MPPTAHQCGAAGHSGVVISFKNFLFDMPLIIYISPSTRERSEGCSTVLWTGDFLPEARQNSIYV